MAGKSDTGPGEQLDLIDVTPENCKAIIKEARNYKKLVKARLVVSAEEVAQKEVVKALMKEAKLQPLPNGKTKFVHDGVTVLITPRDELVQVEDKAEE